MSNQEAIARGKSSSQARDEGCQMCREKGKCEVCFGELDEHAQYGVCSRCREEESEKAQLVKIQLLG
mgnify:CR=1 FL=1